MNWWVGSESLLTVRKAKELSKKKKHLSS
jgi:hypothetical protein